MITKAGLEGELMINLRELADVEENELKILAAVYMNGYRDYQKQKLEDFQNSIEQQIVYYDKKRDEYEPVVKQFVEQYSCLLEQIIMEYNTRFVAIMNEINDTEANQKIAITNMKLSMASQSGLKQEAARVKKNNYEIVLQECFRQLENCPNELFTKLNEIFYSRSNQLMVKKQNMLQKIINIFTGKYNAQKFVFACLKVELANLENKIKDEVQNINYQTIQNVAVIKEAQIQTQKVFNRMLKG